MKRIIKKAKRTVHPLDGLTSIVATYPDSYKVRSYNERQVGRLTIGRLTIDNVHALTLERSGAKARVTLAEACRWMAWCDDQHFDRTFDSESVGQHLFHLALAAGLEALQAKNLKGFRKPAM